MNAQEADELLKALTSAYVWVASADADVSASEHEKFERLLVESPFATQFKLAHVRPYFHDMVTAFADDFAKARTLTRERIKAFKDFPAKSEEILRLTRAATVADGRLQDTEETILMEIATILGVKGPV